MGEIADGVNALISLGRGDVAGATLSATSMLPIVGDAIGKGGKIARAAIKHGNEIVDGTKDSARIIKNARQRAVRNAWKQEKEMVEMKGYGTRNWMKSEIRELKETGKVKGYQGHHINNVKDHPEMARNPNNVEFLNKTEHLESHGGNYRNMTEGPLLAPFIIGAVLVVATSLGISWKSSGNKQDAATPLNILGHTIACNFFLPAWTFVRERGHTLDKTPEALQKKLRKKMEDMGYTQQYLDFFWHHVEQADGAKLRNAVSRLAEVREELQKKLPGTGKLYKKDFKESTLYKKAKEHCNTMNGHCSHLGHKMENERAIENLLRLLDKTR